jgi:hypothetical protein
MRQGTKDTLTAAAIVIGFAAVGFVFGLWVGYEIGYDDRPVKVFRIEAVEVEE